MLEKIGLPPKPSLRGNSWVVDASHCQGCASQFTFINRKHHCRRCGGIFCGVCTQQRMVLRGQGDSPVRICDPCKKLEEASRFELRHGSKNRAVKGGSKLASTGEDDIEAKHSSKQVSGSASSSNIRQAVGQLEGGDTVRNFSLDQSINLSDNRESAAPEELREQALLEKQKYKTLKAEGKSEEALKAFKRGKDLERRASALEISLRKNRKKALSTSNLDDAQQADNQFRASSKKNKLSTEKSKEKDDLSAELKELGWSDVDLHDAEKKPAILTVEGELSSLLREVSQKPAIEKQSTNSDRSQVLAHKKKALELKRAGNLNDAKEELKRAKILERKIEEEELLGGADDSDDELSSLMRSLESDEHNDLSSKYNSDISFDFTQAFGAADDLGADGNFEVTNEDMEDPEIASALKSLGWDEDEPDSEDIHGPISSSSRESLLNEIQRLKREAVNQKRAGNTSEAMTLLRKAKGLEMEVSSSDTQNSDFGVKDSTTVQQTVFAQPTASKSKLTIQSELIAMKKKALTLRREGRLDESQEELRKAKVLEQQLEEMNEAPVLAQPSSHIGHTATSAVPAIDGDEQEEVTDRDLNDPTYLSLLKNLGWEDEDNAKNSASVFKETKSKENTNSFVSQSTSKIGARTSKSRSEIQRELLMLKRKALTLRRQGEVEAADEVLKDARVLEMQLQEYDEPTERPVPSESSAIKNASIDDAPQHSKSSVQKNIDEVGIEDPHNQETGRFESEVPLLGKEISNAHDLSSSPTADFHREHPVDKKLDDQELNSSQAMDSSSPQQQILAHKRKALSLKREGKLGEAKEELRLAKLLEKRVKEETQTQSSTNSGSDASSSDKKEVSPSSKPLSSRERFKLQQESLAHKRQALKLRREGKTAEADAEFELAKAIEAQLQEVDQDSSGPSDDVRVEDFLDPQLMSALQSIGIEDLRTSAQSTKSPEPAKANADAEVDIEKKQLSDRIKAEKQKAVNLKHSGKQAEALNALRKAKLYEKKLQSLN
ncbi:uncharacterized protein LOC127252898 isoform X2 [Andrographis paniculata]|uniref:uncharacterized protein LOC127252898 isoform X2 n=1 Tax=Andrographis paniculata TaxID=175694 RepID=UPI0021E7687C|nr:uncharacterized protein LOC127252898 isoform X2 [Andrographis paniculata]